jgi:predicted enzyme related to lactoylglutathione lyase
MGKPVVHFEIGCRDLPQAVDFYSQLFDWNITGEAPAAMIDTRSAGRGATGHISSLGHEPHQYTIFYVEVESLGDSLKKVEELGGKMLVPPIPLPTGTFAWIADPGGNTVGLWQPNSSANA